MDRQSACSHVQKICLQRPTVQEEVDRVCSCSQQSGQQTSGAMHVSKNEQTLTHSGD